jgi:hypothetical protein
MISSSLFGCIGESSAVTNIGLRLWGYRLDNESEWRHTCQSSRSKSGLPSETPLESNAATEKDQILQTEYRRFPATEIVTFTPICLSDCHLGTYSSLA